MHRHSSNVGPERIQTLEANQYAFYEGMRMRDQVIAAAFVRLFTYRRTRRGVGAR